MVSSVYGQMWSPPFKGYESGGFNAWSFLIEHPSGRKLVYDLGMRKDWENLAAPNHLQTLRENGTILEMEIKDDVAGILKRGGVKLEDIEGVIWSHW